MYILIIRVPTLYKHVFTFNLVFKRFINMTYKIYNKLYTIAILAIFFLNFHDLNVLFYHFYDSNKIFIIIIVVLYVYYITLKNLCMLTYC